MSTSPPVDTSPRDELTEMEALFSAYLDGELAPQERADFETRLREDPDFQAQYQGFAEIMQGLRAMPFAFAQDDFVPAVQRRIRVRSNGMFFSHKFLTLTRIPYEVIAVVMMLIMAAIYLMMDIGEDVALEDVPRAAPAQTETAPAQEAAP